MLEEGNNIMVPRNVRRQMSRDNMPTAEQY